ncbi:MAG TPA: hypothetical protein VGD88_03780 [Opitutaceae bacterium]
MLVIRRLVDRRRAYTALMLPGEPPKIFPTSDVEHARILQIYKQDRAYPGIVNDFTDYDPPPAPAPAPQPTRKTGFSSRRRTGSSQSS